MEQWRQTAESLEIGYRRFWTSHSETIAPEVLYGPKTYLISYNRLTVGFRLLSLFTNLVVRLIKGTVMKYDVKQVTDKKVRITFGFNKERSIWLMKSLEAVFTLSASLFSMTPKHLPERILKVLVRFFIIKAEDSDRLVEDLGNLISKDKVGLVKMTREKTPNFVPFSAFIELLTNVEKNLPLGKPTEVAEFGEETTMEVSVRD